MDALSAILENVKDPTPEQHSVQHEHRCPCAPLHRIGIVFPDQRNSRRGDRRHAARHATICPETARTPTARLGDRYYPLFATIY
jgi:hypothetical protein